jgi:hypothetical protein
MLALFSMRLTKASGKDLTSAEECSYNIQYSMSSTLATAVEGENS